MYFTTKRTLGNDLTAGIKYVERLESRRQEENAEDVKVVLVGHSSGGGLSQMILNTGKIKVSGLALVAAIPIFGK
jgi:pimeloyl-ACP methyl ester carboxylesterase